MRRQPAEQQHDSDNQHQHENLICGHTPSFVLVLKRRVIRKGRVAEVRVRSGRAPGSN
jgi:hypothetical protein